MTVASDKSDITGQFDPATKGAVMSLYAHLGYSVPTTGGPYDPADHGDRQALQAAQSAVDTATQNVEQLQQQSAAARAAKSRSSSGAASAGGDSQSLEQQLASARTALYQANQNQNYLISTTGPMMPMAEALFVSTLPAKVTGVSASVGTAVGTSPLLTIDSGQLTVTSDLTPSDAALLHSGLTATFYNDTLGTSIPGTVARLGAVTAATQQAGSAGASATTTSQSNNTPYVPVTFTADTPIPAAWLGANVRVTVNSASTGTAVMAVPVGAISTQANGQTVVTKVTGAQTLTTIPVKTEASAGGFVQVSAANAASLAVGDQVLIGT